MNRPPYVSFHVKSAAPGRRVASRDIVESVVEEVRRGALPPGCRLPPVRVLELQLGISKNTVQVAYDELVARGVVESRERDGVYVTTPPAGEPRKLEELRPAPVPIAPRFTRPMLPSFAPSPLPADGITLSSVFIDPDLLPRERLAECLRSVMKSRVLDSAYELQGFAPLRKAIARRLCARGIEIDAGEVLITLGSQQALDVAARVLDVRRVAVENPVYAHAKLLFETQGIELTPLDLDPFRGIDLDLWAERLSSSRPGLLYATTSFQNPTGYSYSLQELLRLLELSAEHGFALLEDDWGSDMLSQGEYRPTLRVLGGSDVLYVNSFTKKVLPSLRLGFVVAPAKVMAPLVAAKRLSSLGAPILLEAALFEFLDRGYYDTHLADLQKALDARYERALALLRDAMPEGVRWTTPGGGPTLWLDFPRQVDLRALRARLAARNVFVEDTSNAFANVPAHLHGFRVSYAYVPEAKLARAIEVVAEEAKRALADLPREQ